MKHLIRCAAIGAIALLTMAGCHAPAQSGEQGADSPMELKVYDVPAAQSEQLRHALTAAMTTKASVSVAAPGRLLVYAPQATQASIGEAITELGKAETKQVAPMQVDVHFWVIDGQSGAGDDDPALKGLAGSLASLRQTMGPLHFRLDQAAALVGTSNGHGSLVTADGPYPRSFYFQVAAIDGDTARLQLSYEDNGGHGLGKLDTHIDATFGQYIVLAQAPGACPQPSTNTTMATCTDKPAVRLLVVRVDRLPAKA